MIFNQLAQDDLYHEGVSILDGAPGRGSGRYPYGSGDNPHQHGYHNFLERVEDLRKKNIVYVDEKTGKTYTGNTAIAYHLGLTTSQYRVQLSLANEEERSAKVKQAKELRAAGYSLNKIAEAMGFKNDSSVRTLLNEKSEDRMNESKVTAEFLKKMVAEKGKIDVGAGVERELGISREKLNEALYRLELEGYPTYGGGLAQVTNPGKQTNLKVLCPPGTQHKEIYDGNIASVRDYDEMLTNDGAKIKKAFEYPASIDPKRVAIRYAEDGGLAKDGVVEIRRGVDDVSLKNEDGVDSNYAQVRILVNGTHYIKGMAVYSDGSDMPKGVDLVFNTNKPKGTPMLGDKDNTVLKNIKTKDPNDPFGALIKEHGGQSHYIDANGEEKLRYINKTREEGDWEDWAKKLPAQFLAKQPMKLVDQQLKLTIAERKEEFDEIRKLNNPVIKRYLLGEFANDCDSSAVHLKAASLPRQRYQVILPLTTIKDNEVFAPNFENGERLALVRFPHAGTFEIPILKVNNKNAEGKKVITTGAKDAVGISAKAAAQLSGADFDGDTVMVVPISSKVNINASHPLDGLKDFDPKLEYGPSTATGPYKKMTNTQKQMGSITNLIADMTIKGAHEDEIVRAVKHSMVVIDAEKHNLDYKRSEKDNDIAALKRKYQGRVENGRYTESASTLITRAKSEQSVEKRQGTPRVNQKGKEWYDPTRPEGALIYKTADNLTYPERKKVKDPNNKGEYLKDENGKYIYQETGKTITRTQKSTQMAEVDDARVLSSGRPVEERYAKFANDLKGMANQARIEQLSTGRLKYNATANNVYKAEVDSLNSKLREAEKNSPRERQAQIIASNYINAIKRDNPDLERKELKKASDRALKEARIKVGAQRTPIDITDREWEAIQSGAISDSQLTKMLKYTDTDELRKRATPRATKELNPAKQSLIRSLKNSGYTNAEIAKRLDTSISTIVKYSK